MIGAGGPSLNGIGGTGGYIQGTINVSAYHGQTISTFVGGTGNLNPDVSAGTSYINILNVPGSTLFVMAGAGGSGSGAGGSQYGGWGGGGSFVNVSGNNYVAAGGNGQTSGDGGGAQGGQTVGGGIGGYCGDPRIVGNSGGSRPIPENYLQALGGTGQGLVPGGSGYTGGGEGCGAGGGSSYYNSASTAIIRSYDGSTLNSLHPTLLSGYGRAYQGGYVSITLN
jgi:hypothetical protein